MALDPSAYDQDRYDHSGHDQDRHDHGGHDQDRHDYGGHGLQQLGNELGRRSGNKEAEKTDALKVGSREPLLIPDDCCNLRLQERPSIVRAWSRTLSKRGVFHVPERTKLEVSPVG